jgi:hypothetical protein
MGLFDDIIQSDRPPQTKNSGTTNALATEFGYNDPEDNGVGAWGDITNNPYIQGVSLNRGLLKKQFGDENKAHGQLVKVTNPDTGKSIVAPIIDKGPADWVVDRQGNTIDLTHAANQAIGGTGKTPVQYEFVNEQAQKSPQSTGLFGGYEMLPQGQEQSQDKVNEALANLSKEQSDKSKVSSGKASQLTAGLASATEGTVGLLSGLGAVALGETAGIPVTGGAALLAVPALFTAGSAAGGAATREVFKRTGILPDVEASEQAYPKTAFLGQNIPQLPFAAESALGYGATGLTKGATAVAGQVASQAAIGAGIMEPMRYGADVALNKMGITDQPAAPITLGSTAESALIALALGGKATGLAPSKDPIVNDKTAKIITGAEDQTVATPKTPVAPQAGEIILSKEYDQPLRDLGYPDKIIAGFNPIQARNILSEQRPYQGKEVEEAPTINIPPATPEELAKAGETPITPTTETSISTKEEQPAKAPVAEAQPETTDATKAREVQESNQPEHPNGDETRQATETSSGDSVVTGEEEAPKEEVVVPLQKQDKTYLSLLKKAKPVGEDLYELSETQITKNQRNSLLSDIEKQKKEKGTLIGGGNPLETDAFYLKPKSEVTGDPYAKGWILKDKRPLYLERKKSELQKKSEAPVKSEAPKEETLGQLDLSGLEQKAIEARNRIQQRRNEGRVNMGIDPEDLADHAIIGADYINKGLNKFGDWSKQMLSDFGNYVRPFLNKIWDLAKKVTNAISTGGGTFTEQGSKTGSAGIGGKGFGEGKTPEQKSTTDVPKVETTSQTETTPEQKGKEAESLYGINAKSFERQAEQAGRESIPRGEGLSPTEARERGHQLLKDGFDPIAAMERFEKSKDKAVAEDTLFAARAYGEKLATEADKAANKFGENSPEYKKINAQVESWNQRIKPMSTIWQRLGAGHQGEVELDTGNLRAMERSYKEDTGKTFTAKQKEEAKRKADDVIASRESADSAKKKLYEQLELFAQNVFAPVPKNLDEARLLFEKFKEGSKPTIQQVKTLWNVAKKFYIDRGEDDFTNMVNGLATDFGLSVDDVRNILAQPKGSKRLTDEMYKKMSDRRKFDLKAKDWLKDQQFPGYLQFIRKIPRTFFAAKVFGHGTVGMITHAGINVFNPMAWKTYWPEFIRQFKFVGSKAYHEQYMQQMTKDPLYITARRAGLENDPFKYLDDYQSSTKNTFLQSFSGFAGNKGFDALKTYRQARFNQIWNSSPESLRNPEYAKLIATTINHETGIVKQRYPEWMSDLAFAPKLEASRWAWLIGDPAKAANTIVNWKTATPEARASAIHEIKTKATILGTYLGALAVNQGLLWATGSKDNINITNPKRSDFLAFKFGDYKLSVISPMIGTFRLLANLYHDATAAQSKFDIAKGGRAGSIATTVEQYARGKLSPFGQVIADISTQSDWKGHPMPWSNDLPRKGQEKVSWGEFATETAAPIPLQEAITEVWRSQGMNENMIQQTLRALLVGGVTGATGARVSPYTPPQEPTRSKKSGFGNFGTFGGKGFGQ